MKRTREVAAQQSAAEREAKLSPYRSVIDKYVLRFSDKPLRIREVSPATEHNVFGRSFLSNSTF
jgi:hypothetical protein